MCEQTSYQNQNKKNIFYTNEISASSVTTTFEMTEGGGEKPKNRTADTDQTGLETQTSKCVALTVKQADD